MSSSTEPRVVPFEIRPLDGGSEVGTRSTAQAEGYATGWAQGMRAARTATAAARDRIGAELGALLRQRDADLRQAVRAVESAAAALHARQVAGAEEIADTLLATAVELAEALLGAELSAGTTAGRDALRRALAHVPAGKPVTVRLCPTDHAKLIAEGIGIDDRAGTVTLVADAALAPGDAIAETQESTVDARLATALHRVRAELGLPAGEVSA